jgi:hypothetical protein
LLNIDGYREVSRGHRKIVEAEYVVMRSILKQSRKCTFPAPSRFPICKVQLLPDATITQPPNILENNDKSDRASKTTKPTQTKHGNK